MRPFDRTFVSSLRGTLRSSDLLASEVGLLFQHMIDSAHIDFICRSNLVLILTTPMTQPNINRFVVGKLRLVQDGLPYVGPLDLLESRTQCYLQ